MRTMARATALGLLLWLPLAAQAEELGWVVQIKDREAGEEQAAWTAGEGGARLESQGEMRLIQEPFRYTQTLEVGPQGAFRSYALTSGTHVLEVAVVDSAIQISGTVVGREAESTLPAPKPVVCLDNLVFSHYDVVGRLAVQQDGPFEFIALVPQALAAPPARFEPGEPVEVYGPGGAIAARRGTIAIAGLTVELIYDAASGRAYAVDVPSQALRARAKGVRLSGGGSEPGPQATAYLEREVSFASPYGTLPGTLTLPRGEGPFPTALVLPGSGPTDRHSTVGPNRPLEDLARGLAAEGVASLRFDKRAHLIREALRKAATAEARDALLEDMDETLGAEYVEDALAALAWLRGREGIDPARIVLLGHSLGALAAPEVAAAEGGEVAGLALLAAPGRRFDVLLEEQIAFQAGLKGLDEAAARARAQQVLTGLREILAGERDASQRVLGAKGSYWLDVCSRDLPAQLRASALPVLVLQGGNDCQVGRADFEALQAALAARGDPPATCTLYPELNHLFVPVEGQSTGAEYAQPADMDPRVAKAVADWVAGLPR